MTFEVREGDCVQTMRAMPACSVDSLVCDPPAGISFMGRSWDHHRGGRNEWVEWMAEVLSEALRVCKPGAHAFVWSLPRTSHWTGSALELAGWEVRDCVTHLFGSGFPKSHNLPNGFGTALKPAAEFWWLARKPLSGTVAANCLEHGTGALNVDATRVGTDGGGNACPGGDLCECDTDGRAYSPTKHPVRREGEFGRWPANVVLSHMEGCVPVGTRKVKTGTAVRKTGISDAGSFGVGGGGGGLKNRGPEEDATYASPDGTETVTAWRCHPDCPVRLLDEQTGELTSGSRAAGEYGRLGYQGWDDGPMPAIEGDAGGASRFFYVAKASRAERGAGLNGAAEGNSKICVCHGDEASGEASPLRAIGEPAGTDDSRWSTSGSGSKPMDPSPTDTKSTSDVCPDCGGVVQGALRNSHPT